MKTFNFNKKDFRKALKEMERLDNARKWILSILAAMLTGIVIGILAI